MLRSMGIYLENFWIFLKILKFEKFWKKKRKNGFEADESVRFVVFPAQSFAFAFEYAFKHEEKGQEGEEGQKGKAWR